VPKNTPDMAQLNGGKAYEPSLNSEPGCIKVVDTFRRASSPEGLASTSARQRSSVPTLIPTVCETASTGELSGGNNRATTRSLNF
jgi:hypothetical protein